MMRYPLTQSIAGKGRLALQVTLRFMVFATMMMSCMGQPSQGQPSADDLLSIGHEALAAGMNNEAVNYYLEGIKVFDEEEDSLLTILSLETNLATALSSLDRDDEAVDHYTKAISTYGDEIDDIVDKETMEYAKSITASASFYLGMVLQDQGNAQKAADAYGYTVVLDPYHWSALANLGSVLHDQLRLHDEALQAYNKAYEILTQTEVEPTDAPEEPRLILSQLQYRIGLCIHHDLNRKCAVADDPTTPVSCKEMATHAFSLAVRYDPENVSAQHMLATITADATMKRASNTYIKNLFDDYAQNFEHSLVKELGYNGYERLRKGFDTAFGGQANTPTFDIVVDAGCGTGLVGEQFRNISTYMIGVDLSQAILDEAESLRPGLYDEKIAGDVTEVFISRGGSTTSSTSSKKKAKENSNQKQISLIIAADSYIYFGDLIPLFESMEVGLQENGYIAFTLENVGVEDEITLTESKPDWRWQLTPSGRFAHRKEYVINTGREYNMDVIYYEPLDGFRHEHGKSVRGHLFVMQKKTTTKKKEQEQQQQKDDEL